jgi:membrane protein implicated in regulation of membrane protease activity
MIVLGFILIIVAAAAVLFALASGGTLTASPLTAIGVTVNVTPLAMFVAGAVSLLLVVLGLALISRGTKRSVHTRRELRQLRKGQSKQPATTPAPDRSGSEAEARPGGTAAESAESAGTRGGTSDGLGEERRMTAGDASNDRPAGNEYPPAPR